MENKQAIGDKQRLEHIVEAMFFIEQFMKDVPDYEAYTNDLKLRLALVKLIENIGEATASLSDSLKDEFTEVEWRTLKIVRNILVHEYFGIDYKIIWDAIQHNIPVLKPKIEHILTTKFPKNDPA